MSGMQLSFGYMAKLSEPVVFEDFMARMEHMKLPIECNYEGTIVFIDESTVPADDIVGMWFLGSPENFKHILRKSVINIDEASITPYVCNWYNGADSYMSDFPLADFDTKVMKS